jgi:fido (protein-threonine AMPylation protein)
MGLLSYQYFLMISLCIRLVCRVALVDPMSGQDPALYTTHRYTFDRVFDQDASQVREVEVQRGSAMLTNREYSYQYCPMSPLPSLCVHFHQI